MRQHNLVVKQIDRRRRVEILHRATAAAEKAATWKDRRDQAIHRAYRVGCGYTAIARATGLHRTQVRRILGRPEPGTFAAAVERAAR